MKKQLSIVVINMLILSFLFATSMHTAFDLEDLNYQDDIYLYGITSYIDFFYPLYYTDDISNAEFSLHYDFTQFVGLDSLYTFFVNDEPVYTFYFLDYDGNIRIKIPNRYLEKASLLKITLAVTLDYSICDNKRIEATALWFRIDRETTLSYDYKPSKIDTIPEFFSIYNPKKTYNIVFNNASNNFQAIANIGEHLGYSEKNVEQFPLTSQTTMTEANNIILTADQEGNNVYLLNNTLYVDPSADVHNSFKPLYYNYSPSSSLTILTLNKHTRDNFVPLDKLGVTAGNINVVYNAVRNYDFGIDAFGGVPLETQLNLNFSVFNRLHSSGNTLAVFLNGYLLKSYDLNDMEKLMYADTINIPSEYFRAFNTLSFEMNNMKSDCDEFTLRLYPNSAFTYSAVQPLENVSINDFPNSVYGNTLYVVSKTSEVSANNLLKIAFEKGKASLFPDRATVFTVEEIFDSSFNFDNFDSIVFLVDSKDVSRIDPFIDLSDVFTIKKNDGEILFSAKSNGDFDIVRAFEFEGIPSILFTHYGQEGLIINKNFLTEMKRIPGNLGIFTYNELFSFEIGKKSNTFFLAANAETQQETLMGFWEKYRLWIIIIVAAFILIVLLVSYGKTSRGR